MRMSFIPQRSTAEVTALERQSRQRMRQEALAYKSFCSFLYREYRDTSILHTVRKAFFWDRAQRVVSVLPGDTCCSGLHWSRDGGLDPWCYRGSWWGGLWCLYEIQAQTEAAFKRCQSSPTCLPPITVYASLACGGGWSRSSNPPSTNQPTTSSTCTTLANISVVWCQGFWSHSISIQSTRFPSVHLLKSLPIVADWFIFIMTKDLH